MARSPWMRVGWQGAILGNNAAAVLVYTLVASLRGQAAVGDGAGRSPSAESNAFAFWQGLIDMQRQSFFRTVWLGLFLVGLTMAGASSQNPAPADLRVKSEMLLQQGNFQEAYQGFRQLCLDPKAEGVESDLSKAVQCLNRLGRTAELDALLEGTIAAHKDDWELLAAAAQHYLNEPHHGFLIAGKFERGGHRGGGQAVNSMDRDRVRALQLMVLALPLAQQDDQKHLVSRHYVQLAGALLSNRGHHEAWRLQYLTDLKTLPDYEEGFSFHREYHGAPVDADGNPVFHQLADSWEAAKTDGERWRWCLAQAVENDPGRKNEVLLQQAQFYQEQFGVQTLALVGWRFPRGQARDDDTEVDESGTYALHTLKETETIAKLASGIKRFDLPDEFNHIKLYQQVLAGPNPPEYVYTSLAHVFENRRQYPRAAEVWREAIAKFGPGTVQLGQGHSIPSRQFKLDQIVGNWGRFEATTSQPAGQGATVGFVFRNGKQVKFDARAVKVDLLLADVKEHLKRDPGNRIDWQQINIQDIGYRLINEGGQKYLGEAAAAWELELEPRENHWDRRITVTTPLQKAGAYLLTATMDGGNTSKVVLWVADTAIVHKQLSEKNLYYVADAASGQPIPEINLEFFGWQQRHLGGNRFQVVTTNFAELTSPDGMVTPDPRDLKSDFQWLIVARGKQSRLAYLGFTGAWTGQRHDPEYNEVKVFTMTDRPVYRPEQKVEFKLWVARAQYDVDQSQFAGVTLPIAVFNPKGEKIYTKTLTADEFGGLVGELELPKDATLGQYNIQLDEGHNLPLSAMAGNTFRVEEYKKPEYEVSIEAPKKPVMLGEKITAQIEAKYYFGSPVTKATVKYKVTRESHDETWYPRAPWDWCYGPGYWWFAYDYAWYPGFRNWVGCIRPSPIWWPRGRHTPPEVVAEVEREIGPEGTIDVEIDTLVAKELHPDTDHQYTITAEVRDASRRTIVGTGKVLVARKPFKVYAWVDRGYYRMGDTITASFSAQTLDHKPVQGQGTLKLLKITYDPKQKPIETPVEEWQLPTDAEGRARQQIKAAAPGQYRLSYTVNDGQEHAIEGGYIFTVVGPQFDSASFRFSNLELVPDKAEYAPGDSVRLQLNTNRAGGTLLLFVRPTNGVYLPPKVLRLKGKSTIEEIGVVKRDMPNFFVEAVTIYGGQVYSETKEIVVPPEKRVLNVAVEPSADTYKPGEKAKVKLRLTDSQGENFTGSTVLTMYDKSVEYISGGSNVPDIKEFFWKWRRHHHPQHQDSLARWSHNLNIPGKPEMGFIGVFGATLAAEFDALEGGAEPQMAMADGNAFGAFGGGVGRGGARMRARVMAPLAAAAPGPAGPALEMAADKAFFAADARLNAAGLSEAEEAAAAGGASLVEPTVRTQFADTALWVHSLTTGKDGTAEVELTMPENLTTWKVQVWGLGHGTEVGEGSAEVVTRKNLIVRLQAPRFFVQKDEVVLSANVHNYLEADKDVTVSLELPNEILVPMEGVEPTTVVKVPAGGETRVDWRCRVLSEGEAIVRMKAQTDEESDAVEQKLPSYIHGILKTESWAGTVKSGQNATKVSIDVPAERRIDQSRLEIRYSPSLAMAMVDALPYLAEYPYGCTEQTLNRFLPSVITQKTLQRMNLDLAAIGEKRTNLNAQEIGQDKERAKQWQRFDRNPVFDPTELDRMVKEGVKALTEQQISDGGWGWFSGVGEQSWPHTTAVVVHGLQIAKANDVPLVPGVLERGVEWLKQYQARQLEWLKNFEQKREGVNKKQFCDAIDAFVYMVLVDADSDNQEMRDRLYRDRVELPVYAKAMFGLALHKVRDQEKLAMIVRNIDQFLVQDSENETAYLKLPENNWWWFWYGNEIEANAYYLKLLALTDPQGEKAPRLVKYLLNNRKHATWWSSTRDTAICVEAFADYLDASGETEPQMTVEVWLDGEKRKEIEITKNNLFTYDNKFVLEGGAVESGAHEVEIRRQGKGNVYFNAYLTNFTLEDHIERAGLEIKVTRQYYKLVPVDKTIKVEGSRGQVGQQQVEKFDRLPLNEGDTLKSGDQVEIELVIESKNDYEYLMFEDMKAAGFEPVTLQSGFGSGSKGMPAYVEYRDNRVAFFIRWLARGRHSLNYRMRAEIPGRFSALPTQAAAMYAPELRANSDEIKLKILDEE